MALQLGLVGVALAANGADVRLEKIERLSIKGLISRPTVLAPGIWDWIRDQSIMTPKATNYASIKFSQINTKAKKETKNAVMEENSAPNQDNKNRPR